MAGSQEARETYKMCIGRTGKMAQQVRGLVELAGHPGSVPSTDMVAHNYLLF